ncbi:hypothetical protein [Nocardioides speluncae]|uniref:hypothetical protein n=1 Tax=Nocardioides speluncae TaxID=2670337 RepID=UPI000D69AE6A|nr:hypothetical protein [Nocardioides speluncae]
MNLHRALLLVAFLLGVAAMLTGALWQLDRAGRAEAPAESRQESPPSERERALMVLRDWDARRSEAYATADVTALMRLYAADSSAGANDVAMLRRYAARGLRVTGIRTQILAADVRELSATTMRLRVTDRMVGARAVSRSETVDLPRDRASTRTISFVRRHGSWVVAEVR